MDQILQVDIQFREEQLTRLTEPILEVFRRVLS
jgi:hypothetical protein